MLGNLAQFIAANKGRMKWKQKLTFLLHIARGVQYLHSKNIIHRDLKAENVLVDSNLICKLTDFGLSKMKDKIKFTKNVGTVCNTLLHS